MILEYDEDEPAFEEIKEEKKPVKKQRRATLIMNQGAVDDFAHLNDGQNARMSIVNMQADEQTQDAPGSPLYMKSMTSRFSMIN